MVVFTFVFELVNNCHSWQGIAGMAWTRGPPQALGAGVENRVDSQIVAKPVDKKAWRERVVVCSVAARVVVWKKVLVFGLYRGILIFYKKHISPIIYIYSQLPTYLLLCVHVFLSTGLFGYGRMPAGGGLGMACRLWLASSATCLLPLLPLVQLVLYTPINKLC